MIDLKLGPVTKLDQKNTAKLKKSDQNISTNYDVIVFLPIYGKFAWFMKLTFSLTRTF